MTYRYVAYTADKKVVEGKIEAPSESAAEGTLYHAGFLNILSLEEAPPSLSLEGLLPSVYGVKQRDVIDGANELATLIQSGLTLSTALRLLEAQTRKVTLKKVFHGLMEEIQAGGSLSQAMARYPRVFPDTFCQVVKASEQAGTLEAGLRRAAAYMEKRLQASQKIRRAMAYPAFILAMAVAVSILLVTVALPPLVQLFKSLGANLPWMTRALVAVTDFLMHYYPYILGALALGGVAVIWAYRHPSVKQAADEFVLKIPLIGSIITERGMVLFCQTGAMLLQAGLRLPQVMDIVIQGSRNRVIKQSFGSVREKLVQGEGLAKPLGQDKVFPPLLVEMITVGEKTGTMDATLNTLADFYERKVDHRIDLLISLIEPILTVIIGLVVIFVALSMITPLYSILRSMH